MLVDVMKPLKVIFKKESLLNLFIFSIVNILNTSAFFLPYSKNHIPATIFYCITFFLLVGYVIETTYLYISNNCEEIKLPTWNINIIKYFKYSFSFLFILLIFELIFSPIYLIHLKWLSIILQLLCVFTFSIIGPCSAVIYAKNLKIKEALNYKTYYQLIKNNLKKFILTYILTTTFFIILIILSSILNSPLIGLKIGLISFYISNYILFIGDFLIILLYSQLFQKERTN